MILMGKPHTPISPGTEASAMQIEYLLGISDTVLQFSYLLRDFDPENPGSFESRRANMIWRLHVERYMLRKRIREFGLFTSPGGIWSGSARKLRGTMDRDRRVLAIVDRLLERRS
jgi:hypothetical protein